MATGNEDLFKACREGDIAALKYSLTLGRNIHAKDSDGLSLLQVAMKNNQIDVLTELLKREVDISNVDSCGISALHWASWTGQEAILELLIKNKRMDYELLNAVDKDNMTPLMLAVQKGHIQCVKLLTETELINWNIRNVDDEDAESLAR